jgi:hypothetical protein
MENNIGGDKGVYLLKHKKKWIVRVSFRRKIYCLGSYDNRDDAIAIRKEAEKRKIDNTFLEWFENNLKPLLKNKLRVKSKNTNRNGHVGVYFLEHSKKWRAQIIYGRKAYVLGVYEDQDSAISIRKEAEKRKFDNTFFEWFEKKFNRLISDKTKSQIENGELLSTGKVAKIIGIKYHQYVTNYAIDNNMTLLGGRYYFTSEDIEKLKEFLKRGRKPKKPKDFTGHKNGMLTAIKPTGKKRNDLFVWVWKCGYCGKEVEYTSYEVFHNNRTSCGCCKHKDVDINSRITFYENTNIDHIKNIIKGSKPPKNNTSGIRGVYYDKITKKWGARIGFKKKNHNLGLYTTKKEATIVRRNSEIKYFQTTIEEFEDYISKLKKSGKEKIVSE